MKDIEVRHRKAAKIIGDMKISAGAMTREIYRLQKENRRLYCEIADMEKNGMERKRGPIMYIKPMGRF